MATPNYSCKLVQQKAKKRFEKRTYLTQKCKCVSVHNRPGRKFTVQSNPKNPTGPTPGWSSRVTCGVTAWLGLNQSYWFIFDLQTRNSNQILRLETLKTHPGAFFGFFGTLSNHCRLVVIIAEGHDKYCTQRTASSFKTRGSLLTNNSLVPCEYLYYTAF